MPTLTASTTTRREFLRLGGQGLASTAMLATLGSLQDALAATAITGGYRALVCVYLAGGNDGFNMIVPRSASAYRSYQTSRSNLALDIASLLPLESTASDGNSYGMHPSCPELRTMFNDGDAAIVANVGTLVQPTTAAQARAGSVPLPLQLFSHADQQTAWWTSMPDQASRFGWAGRIADFYAAQGYSANLAMNINIGGVNYWQEGRGSTPYVLGPNGAATLLTTADTSYRGGARNRAAKDLLTQASQSRNGLVSEYTAIERNAAAKVSLVNSALGAAGDLRTPFPSYPGDGGLGSQLHEVARCIKARSQIGDSRQLFFVRIGGWDTHNGQLGGQASLLRILSQNLQAFSTALNEIGAQTAVTTFTASDFGRSLGSNGDGSDHAWGNHHFVMGGAVRSGYYGTMPSLVIGGADDLGGGRLVPTTSTDTYAATLARWFGVADGDLDAIFPNLSNFGPSRRTLAFLGGA